MIPRIRGGSSVCYRVVKIPARTPFGARRLVNKMILKLASAGAEPYLVLCHEGERRGSLLKPVLDIAPVATRSSSILYDATLRARVSVVGTRCVSCGWPKDVSSESSADGCLRRHARPQRSGDEPGVLAWWSVLLVVDEKLVPVRRKVLWCYLAVGTRAMSFTGDLCGSAR